MKENAQALQTESWTRTEVYLLRFLGTAAFLFLMVLSAQVRIPLPFTPVPMTLQTFVAPLAGGFLGAFCGTASIALYLALGLAGIPVFAQATGGMQFFYAPTAGFLFGLVIAAAMVGWARDTRKSNPVLLISLIASHLVIYACGVAGFMVNTGVTWNEAFTKAVAPFVFGDILKLVASYFVLLSFNHFRKVTKL
jgi:biotin transport system substrate-specific component